MREVMEMREIFLSLIFLLLIFGDLRPRFLLSLLSSSSSGPPLSPFISPSPDLLIIQSVFETLKKRSYDRNLQDVDCRPLLGNPIPFSLITSGELLSYLEKGLHGGLFLMGETLFILRPLVYVWFIKKYGIRLWKPWLISLAVDLVSSSASSLATKSKEGINAQKETNLSVAEKNELRPRKVLWALYIMRDPFFCTYTRRRLESTEKVLEPIPVVGLLTGWCNCLYTYVLLKQQYHMSTDDQRAAATTTSAAAATPTPTSVAVAEDILKLTEGCRLV